MRRLTRFTSMIALAAIVSTPNRLSAQAVAFAQIHGTVTDATAAVARKARVKATQTDTGQVRTPVTSPDGTYVLPMHAVGPYSVEIAANGFKSYVQTGITLQVGNNIQINVALEVGAVSQELRV